MIRGCRVSLAALVGIAIAIGAIVHLTTTMMGPEVANPSLLSLVGAPAASYMSAGAREMLDESMAWMDSFYDADAGYLLDLSSSKPRIHDTRSSMWYACGLLARDGRGDLEEAEKIIRNIIAGQYRDPSKEWYGVYERKPEEPEVGSPSYPAIIYGSWDPNWRGFVSTAMIVAMEEFPHRLSDEIQDLMLDSIQAATVGDSYRFGNIGLGKDNLYPAYSNPAIMRAFASGWTGRRTQDNNMTRAGEAYGQDIIDLFNYFETLSEFNSPTYTGVSLFGLVLWDKYLPADNSTMAKNAPRMIKKTWETVGQVWHPRLRNIAGPWDRVYGYDMNHYLSVMALWLWPKIGKEESGLAARPEAMSHSADYAFAPVLAILDKAHSKLVPDEVVDKLSIFQGEHMYHASAWSPPYDLVWRNYSTWMDEKIAVGGMSFNQVQQGGAGGNLEAFMPVIVQWDTGNEVGFIALITGEYAMEAVVEPGQMTLTFPRGAPHTLFTFAVSTFREQRTVTKWEDLPGLSVNVTGNVDPNYTVKFGGTHGGADKPTMGFEWWHFEYKMPAGYDGYPSIVMQFEVEQDTADDTLETIGTGF